MSVTREQLDRLEADARRTRRIALACAAVCVVSVPLALNAGTLSVPHSFLNGAAAKADEVNANFAAVKTAVDDNDARLASLESGRIRAVTPHTNCVRRTLSGAPQIVMEQFTVDKRSPTSKLLIQGVLSGITGTSGSKQQQWVYGAGSPVNAQGVMYEPNAHGKVFPTAAVISGHTTTGPQTLTFRYQSINSTNDTPFAIYNPNGTDDGRLGQTCSVYWVYEVEP